VEEKLEEEDFDEEEEGDVLERLLLTEAGVETAPLRDVAAKMMAKVFMSDNGDTGEPQHQAQIESMIKATMHMRDQFGPADNDEDDEVKEKECNTTLSEDLAIMDDADLCAADSYSSAPAVDPWADEDILTSDSDDDDKRNDLFHIPEEEEQDGEEDIPFLEGKKDGDKMPLFEDEEDGEEIPDFDLDDDGAVFVAA